MEEYAKLIRDFATNQKNHVFYNSCEEHEKVVLRNLVEQSNVTIRTLCGNLCSSISTDKLYINEVTKFLERNGKMNILFDDYSDDFKLKPLCDLFVRYDRQVKIKKLKDGYDHILYEGKPVHFTVADDKSFRIEIDIIKKAAWGNFNDKSNASIFSDIFDKVYYNNTFTEDISL